MAYLTCQKMKGDQMDFKTKPNLLLFTRNLSLSTETSRDKNKGWKSVTQDNGNTALPPPSVSVIYDKNTLIKKEEKRRALDMH